MAEPVSGIDDESAVVGPTMRGFRWTPREIPASFRGLPGNLWCLRDAYCALFGWEEGSDEWNRFIEAPDPGDPDRLREHLGLSWFDPEYPPHWEVWQNRLDHPGISFYAIHSLQLGHCIYQPHVRYLRPLPDEYRRYDPELFRIVIDTRQPPAPR
jgi:hypothetical protein